MASTPGSYDTCLSNLLYYEAKQFGYASACRGMAATSIDPPLLAI
jgi:hypothetical protein